MARFGQGFINALTRPSYAQGLFETASALGSAPRRAAEERDRKGMLQGLQEALISNDPAVMEAAAANIFQTNPEMGVKLIEKAQGLRTTAQEGRTSRGLQGGLTGITQASSMLNAARAAKDPAKTQEAAQMLREAKRSVVGLGGTAEDIREAEEVGVGSPTDRFKTVGNRIFDVVDQRYIEPSEAAALIPLTQLKDIATPESLLQYAKTGNVDALKPVEKDEDIYQLAGEISGVDDVLTTIKEASGLNEDVFPVFYDLTKYAPNTDARALAGKVSTLKSNLSFDRLQKMRDASKTGGALGNVSNIELDLLGSNVAALDPASKDFATQLEKVEESYERFKATLLGKIPPGDKYIEMEGVLYYADDQGNFFPMGAIK
jgi:hypothetical protein